ncbi:MAG: hypothetical protein WKH64_14955, partial [Chloroflexia bacterium]
WGAVQLLASSSGDTKKVVGSSLGYLQKREEQIRYAELELQGVPIGSGIVESANKLLVEERLSGSWDALSPDTM